MVRVYRAVLLAGAWSSILAMGAAAQPAAPAPATQAPARAEGALQPDELHFQISVMEGVLQRAAMNGALQTSRRFESALPEPLLWNGASRARGFRLENYGIFFDVEVPELRSTMTWSLQMLDQGQSQAEARIMSVLQDLEQQLRTAVTDRQAREQVDQALRRIQVQVVGSEPQAAGETPRVRPAGMPEPPPKETVDPNEAYTTDVKNALIDAMLDHGAPLKIAADEWLTVAARASDAGSFGPRRPYDLVTVILRIRGSDLAATQAALHAGRMTREEARRKMEVKEF